MRESNAQHVTKVTRTEHHLVVKSVQEAFTFIMDYLDETKAPDIRIEPVAKYINGGASTVMEYWVRVRYTQSEAI